MLNINVLMAFWVLIITLKLGSASSLCPTSSKKGDGQCNDENNIEECEWDGGDCCSSTVPGGGELDISTCLICICCDPDASKNEFNKTCSPMLNDIAQLTEGGTYEIPKGIHQLCQHIEVTSNNIVIRVPSDVKDPSDVILECNNHALFVRFEGLELHGPMTIRNCNRSGIIVDSGATLIMNNVVVSDISALGKFGHLLVNKGKLNATDVIFKGLLEKRELRSVFYLLESEIVFRRCSFIHNGGPSTLSITNIENSFVDFIDSEISYNIAAQISAVTISEESDVKFTNCIIRNNTSSPLRNIGRSAIFMEHMSRTSMTNCTIEHNTGVQSMFMGFGIQHNAVVIIEDSILRDNGCTSEGGLICGHIFLTQSPKISISRTTIYVRIPGSGSVLSILGNDVIANMTDVVCIMDAEPTWPLSKLGAIQLFGSSTAPIGHANLYLLRTSFSGFQSIQGSVIYATGASVGELKEVHIRNCQSKRDGGALLIERSSYMKVFNTTFEDIRSISGRGGAIAITDLARIHIEDSIGRNCSAPEGGGFSHFSDLANATLEGTIISHCFSNLYGGALLIDDQSSINCLKTNFISNTVTELGSGGGGAIGARYRTGNYSKMKFIDCVFQENSAFLGGVFFTTNRDQVLDIGTNFYNSKFINNEARALPQGPHDFSSLPVSISMVKEAPSGGYLDSIRSGDMLPLQPFTLEIRDIFNATTKPFESEIVRILLVASKPDILLTGESQKVLIGQSVVIDNIEVRGPPGDFLFSFSGRSKDVEFEKITLHSEIIECKWPFVILYSPLSPHGDCKRAKCFAEETCINGDCSSDFQTCTCHQGYTGKRCQLHEVFMSLTQKIGTAIIGVAVVAIVFGSIYNKKFFVRILCPDLETHSSKVRYQIFSIGFMALGRLILEIINFCLIIRVASQVFENDLGLRFNYIYIVAAGSAIMILNMLVLSYTLNLFRLTSNDALKCGSSHQENYFKFDPDISPRLIRLRARIFLVSMAVALVMDIPLTASNLLYLFRVTEAVRHGFKIIWVSTLFSFLMIGFKSAYVPKYLSLRQSIRDKSNLVDAE